MLANQTGRGTGVVNLKLLAALLVATFTLGSPHALALGDTGKSFAACKAKVAMLVEGQHRVKLDKVKTSRLRLKVLFPNAPRQFLWCDNRGAETRLYTTAGAPFAFSKPGEAQTPTPAGRAEGLL